MMPGMEVPKSRLPIPSPIPWRELGFIALLCVLVLLPRAFGAPGEFDEGFIASGAMMVRRGWVPTADFFVIYGPGQFWFTAGMFAAFGEDVLVLNLQHTLTLALLGALLAQCAFVLGARRLRWLATAGAVYLLLVVAARTGAGYPAVPAALLLVGAALALREWFLSAASHALLGASLLLGLSGWLRWDFGVFGAAALSMTLARVALTRRPGLRTASRWLVHLLGPGLCVMLLGFGPLLGLGDATRWFEEVPKFLALEFNRWRGIEFVRPKLQLIHAAWEQRHIGVVIKASQELLFAAAPFVLAPVAAGVAWVRLRRSAAREGGRDVLALALALMSLCALNQMRVRPGMPQGFPAIALCLPLLSYLAALRPRSGEPSRPVRRYWPRLACAALVVVALSVLYQRLQRPVLGLAKAAWTRVADKTGLIDEGESDYADLVHHVHATTGDGEAIFSGVTDTSRLFINNAMLYFLTDRPSATRWIEMEPGLTNTAKSQRELIGALERQQVKTLILWRRLSGETSNATAISNGIHLFDDYVRANYRESRRFGDYFVMLRSPGAARTIPAQ